MERVFKLIVHVPESHADALREAVGAAGGGVLGHYSHCSFSVRGLGRFRPMEGAVPHIGRVGEPEIVEEEQVHVSGIGESVLAAVVAAVRGVHPYEEPLVEVIELVRV